jgi:hypothetical protein
MLKTIFSGTVKLEVQGESALSLLKSDSEMNLYQLNGFDNPSILIEDYRKECKIPLESFFKNSNPSEFLSIFNSICDVDLLNADDKVRIILHSSTNNSSELIMWSAIGIGDLIPAYDYIFWQIDPIENGLFAFWGVFPINNQKKLS